VCGLCDNEGALNHCLRVSCRLAAVSAADTVLPQGYAKSAYDVPAVAECLPAQASRMAGAVL